MLSLIFEMETSDPDDFMTLLWLADHPKIDLLGVLVTPGSFDQCQLVQWGLNLCGRTDIPIGALHGSSWWESQDGQMPRVSDFHYKVYGESIRECKPKRIWPGPNLLNYLLSENQKVTVLVGSAPKNLGTAFRSYPSIRLDRWIQQGGFAGDNLVSNPLEKFKGLRTAVSHNPGGARKDVLRLLESDQIGSRLFVSKNVCHGVVWDARLQKELKGLASNRTGLYTMIQALDRYLDDKGTAKAMHDLVAAACAVDERVCEFKEAQIYCKGGEWGAYELEGTRTRISVGFDEERFVNTLAV